MTEKNLGGRPKLPANLRRSNKVNIRVTDSEYEKLKQESINAGFKKVTLYLRYKLGLDEHT